ncbi:MAG: hypothetical protein A2Z28_05865 [Chloroflexi bacterium RBG_16_51_9]|nr:MAG: hypothetical protein A2Z28_05865 [Chloroflexi bacterium RBG_16_51_9]
MRERNISKQQIEKCLEDFQVSRPGEENTRIYDYTDETGYKTSVSATLKGNDWVVVSVWRGKL